MILTGLEKLDKSLSGGIPDGVIVDIFGKNGTGKTQLLLQLMINSIKNGGHVLYFDTTGGFRPCLLYTSPSPRDVEESRMPSSA